jgi:hypothetical protein
MRILGLIVLAALNWSAPAQSQALKNPYSEMAPAEQYRIANREDEIALARSAAPSSISADAQVLVLGRHGYETAVEGKNGFVCFVECSKLLQPAGRAHRAATVPQAHGVGPGRRHETADNRKNQGRSRQSQFQSPRGGRLFLHDVEEWLR